MKNPIVSFKQITFPFVIAAIALATLTSVAQAESVTARSWTKVAKLLANDGALLEGSYLGQGDRSGASYQMHFLQYQERADTFVAVLESESLDLAVLGYVSRSVTDSSYVWRSIGPSDDLEQIEPRPTQTPMYRLRAELNSNGRPVRIELSGTNPKGGAEIVRFNKARAPLMRSAPTQGAYANGAWKIDIRSSKSSNNALWAMGQVWDGKEGSGTETDLARYDLPGVLAIREAVYTGYEPQPLPSVKWAAVSLDRVTQTLFSENHQEELLMFTIQPKDQYLSRPTSGHRLYFTEIN